ncbi:MAG: hypothetical protein HOP03_03760 [Lysobacter sp.]|nr:hypothetical protein [Lysobacter sp.]
MADASRSPHHAGSDPPGWSDVFAALPLAAPPASAWPAVAAQLDQRKAHARSRTWLALAASLFALTLWPVAWMLRDAERDTAAVAASPATIAHAPTTATPSAAIGGGDPRTDPRTDPRADVRADPPVVAGTTDRSARMLSIAASTARPAHAHSARRSADRALRRTTQAPSTAGIAQPQENADTTLETLYSASAQLETLLSFARDTRVESGPAAALASAFDAELATIDAQLAQPGLAAGEQQALWQARVETLQRSTDFESNLRLLAADGGRLDGALVSID